MKMQLIGRPMMGLSWIKLNKADEELGLIAVFGCEKARMVLGKKCLSLLVKKEEKLPVMLLELVF